MATRLFHVSDGPPLTVFTPRPSPVGTPYEARTLVWAVDHVHLPNYLLPRECPRVCWRVDARTTGPLDSVRRRVIVIEAAWVSRLQDAALQVHELDPAGFVLTDRTAGYWTSGDVAAVVGVTRVDDCATALSAHDVELRCADDLQPWVDAVVAADCEFSVIRMRDSGRLRG